MYHNFIEHDAYIFEIKEVMFFFKEESINHHRGEPDMQKYKKYRVFSLLNIITFMA